MLVAVLPDGYWLRKGVVSKTYIYFLKSLFFKVCQFIGKFKNLPKKNQSINKMRIFCVCHLAALAGPSRRALYCRTELFNNFFS